jgi:hypothetical protein
MKQSPLDEAVRYMDTYVTDVINPLTKTKYPVYKNPSRENLIEMSPNNLASFVSYNNNLYVFHECVNPRYVLSQILNMVTESNNTLTGTLKIHSNGSLSFLHSSKHIRNIGDLKEHKQWFT